jgi:carotenoid 1,2-hydratase
MRWQGTSLIITIDERCAPLPFKVQGTVTLQCEHLYNAPKILDTQSKHYWQAIGPHARVDVRFSSPKLTWRGNAYHDMNWGDEPLESGFQNWTWQRVATREGSAVFYDALRLDGTRQNFGMQFESGKIKSLKPPTLHKIKSTFWRLDRNAVSEKEPKLLATLEDAPFYTRNHLGVTHDGKSCDTIQESLSLLRFKKPWVQRMLPYRMLRRA